MTVAQKFEYMTVEEYLKFEETSEVRHEYVDGRIFAMTGATRRHNIISGNIFAVVHGFLVGTPCTAFVEGMKARVEAANCFYYPDVMVSCDSNDGESLYIEEPVLVIEVLSPSTAAIVRREKLTNYMKLPTLIEYLIVHQRRRKIELYRKDVEGHWSKTEYTGEDRLVLKSLRKGELSISLNTIYEKVTHGKQNLEVRESEEGYYMSQEEAAVLDW
jgi:Uma2 family endonuclease